MEEGVRGVVASVTLSRIARWTAWRVCVAWARRGASRSAKDCMRSQAVRARAVREAGSSVRERRREAASVSAT